MGLSVKVDSFQYTAGSTANIVLSGWGFQPKFLIFHFNGRASATDAVGAATVRPGWGFATGSADQRCGTTTSTLGGASSAGATWHRNDAIVTIVSDAAVEDGRFAVSTMDSGGATLTVPDAISIDLTVMVIGVGGTDITNAVTGQDTANTVTGNKSNNALAFQPDIVFFFAIHDGNATPPGGSNSEDGISFGVAMSATKQYCVAGAEDDGSANMDTGSYITDAEFLSSQAVANPLSVVDRKTMVSLDNDGFTWNQLELPQTAGSIFHFLAVKGGSWDVGDLLTQTDTTTTVTETLAFTPSLIIMASANRAKSTQDTGTVHRALSFGAATSPSARMAMAMWDENGTANAESANAVEYDEIYANISASDVIQGLGDITGMASNTFDFIMDDADPAQNFAFWIAAGPTPEAGAATNPGWFQSLGGWF